MPLLRKGQTLLLTGLMASTIGCAKEPDRTPATESAATVEPARTPSDSSMTPDENPSAAPAESSAAKPPVAAAQTKPITLPKPSIDPGRKPAKETRPRPAAKPASDTTKSAAVDSTSTGSASVAPTPAGDQSQWLKYDAGSNTVTFELIAGPFNFNGYTSGGATLTVPAKANVVMNFINKDGTPHSAEVISGEGAIPNAAVDAALPRAYTNKVLEGLPQEGSDVMRFTVPESGTYRIFCGVPGHGLGGMWIWMKVDASAKTPSFGPTKT
jgi:hypothetical protein